jgi:hypothetical protein
VILAVDPERVERLTGCAFKLTKIRAACLDVALHRAPCPKMRFVLGIDVPIYYSLHSASAELAPGDGAVLHVAKYLPPAAGEEPSEAAVRSELEALLDYLQPSWREQVVEAQWLPRMTVSHAVWPPGCRPAEQLACGIHLAGDWVGNEGMLADAALASGRAAARSVLESASRVRQCQAA